MTVQLNQPVSLSVWVREDDGLEDGSEKEISHHTCANMELGRAAFLLHTRTRTHLLFSCFSLSLKSILFPLDPGARLLIIHATFLSDSTHTSEPCDLRGYLSLRKTRNWFLGL